MIRTRSVLENAGQMAKEAAAEEKKALTKVASACVQFGAELAMSKLAEMEEEAKAEEEAEKNPPPFPPAAEGEGEGEEDEELTEEETKEAAAMGLFNFEGYINKLAEAGQVECGDPAAYIRQLAYESGNMHKAAAAYRHMNGMLAKRAQARQQKVASKPAAPARARAARRAR